jgi:hypothetical protein
MNKITTLAVMVLLAICMAACGSVTTATDKTPSGTGSGTGSTGHTSSTENVDELIAMVNDFVASGEITGQAENGLLAKLATIQQKVLKGQSEAAANEMSAFVNQVQAQVGKKISEPAATALIAKAQEVAAEFLAGVPVTGAQATVVPTASTLEIARPTPLGDLLEHQAQWDLIAQQVVQSVGLSTFDYDLYQLPANSAWEATLAHYQSEAAAAGWGAAPSQTSEMAGGHYAVWSVTGSDGAPHYFIVAQVDTADGVYTLNILGSK